MTIREMFSLTDKEIYEGIMETIKLVCEEEHARYVMIYNTIIRSQRLWVKERYKLKRPKREDFDCEYFYDEEGYQEALDRYEEEWDRLEKKYEGKWQGDFIDFFYKGGFESKEYLRAARGAGKQFKEIMAKARLREEELIGA